MHNERTVVKILREIAFKNGFEFRTFSYDWVKAFYNGKNSMFVYGYNFPINSTSFTQIANDKACTSEILSFNGISNVEHYYFMNPVDLHYVKYLGIDGNWKRMLDILETHGKILCKPNFGTGGTNISIVSSADELEQAVNLLFTHESAICLCPFYNIENEYRVIILDGEIKLIFKKIRPFVIGNGIDNLASLCAKSGKIADSSMISDLSYIPKNDEKIEIGWKHNLGQGSLPEVLERGNTFNTVGGLALKALAALGGRFASVDCVYANNQYRVLEINSGVMMDNFANTSNDNYNKAKNIYKAAIDKYFEMLK